MGFFTFARINLVSRKHTQRQCHKPFYTHGELFAAQPKWKNAALLLCFDVSGAAPHFHMVIEKCHAAGLTDASYS
jgi:hypothetical protein